MFFLWSDWSLSPPYETDCVCAYIFINCRRFPPDFPLPLALLFFIPRRGVECWEKTGGKAKEAKDRGALSLSLSFFICRPLRKKTKTQNTRKTTKSQAMKKSNHWETCHCHSYWMSYIINWTHTARPPSYTAQPAGSKEFVYRLWFDVMNFKCLPFWWDKRRPSKKNKSQQHSLVFLQQQDQGFTFCVYQQLQWRRKTLKQRDGGRAGKIMTRVSRRHLTQTGAVGQEVAEHDCIKSNRKSGISKVSCDSFRIEKLI